MYNLIQLHIRVMWLYSIFQTCKQKRRASGLVFSISFLRMKNELKEKKLFVNLQQIEHYNTFLVSPGYIALKLYFQKRY